MQQNGNNGARNHAGRAQARCDLFGEGVDGAVGVILILKDNCNGGFWQPRDLLLEDVVKLARDGEGSFVLSAVRLECKGLES